MACKLWGTWDNEWLEAQTLPMSPKHLKVKLLGQSHGPCRAETLPRSTSRYRGVSPRPVLYFSAFNNGRITSRYPHADVPGPFPSRTLQFPDRCHTFSYLPRGSIVDGE